jgi:hypothetical protein
MEGFSNRRSSCLLFQMFSVETHSFLPDEQRDRGDLPRQSEARHRWFHPLGNEGRVEVLERPGDSGGPNGCPLEEIFEIVVMVFVEPADGYEFLGAFDLAFHEAVLPTGAGLQGQAAVRPELPLGAEPVWCLYKREQESCTNRPDRWDLAQQLCCVVLPVLGQQLSPRLLVQEQQCVELLVVHLGPVAHAGLGDFRQPFGAMAEIVA